MPTVEIYFTDLHEGKQNELLAAYGISGPEEANWDMFPVTEIEVYEDED